MSEVRHSQQAWWWAFLHNFLASTRIPLARVMINLVFCPPLCACRAAAGHITAPVHLVAFADEEGIRFQSTFLGSRALVGGIIVEVKEAACKQAGMHSDVQGLQCQRPRFLSSSCQETLP
jgi:hypothetical protein